LNNSTVNNPFASRRVRPGAIPFQFPLGVEAGELVARLARLSWRAAIVGPHGSGKSTLLAALAPEIARAGREVRSIALHDGQRRLPHEFFAALPSGRDMLVVVDGYEQLSFWSRWRLERRCRAAGTGLLITAHSPMALPLLFRTAADLDLAERIVEHLLADRPDCTPTIGRDEVRSAWSKHGGNVRETLFDLYDLFECASVAISPQLNPMSRKQHGKSECRDYRGGPGQSVDQAFLPDLLVDQRQIDQAARNRR
jgi:energy-coupling factor transporter ATP-binding protein EcfA2